MIRTIFACILAITAMMQQAQAYTNQVNFNQTVHSIGLAEVDYRIHDTSITTLDCVLRNIITNEPISSTYEVVHRTRATMTFVIEPNIKVLGSYVDCEYGTHPVHWTEIGIKSIITEGNK